MTPIADSGEAIISSINQKFFFVALKNRALIAFHLLLAIKIEFKSKQKWAIPDLSGSLIKSHEKNEKVGYFFAQLIRRISNRKN
ncbi:hypothetical protein BpHYR1_043906 [Brachionus plicatilis]|uniref:Uncharacterized protein n=1 Tax=Brachionus plicatilis TaxID=10195 RepID=A0A3M7SSW3_BRAPC|nr:hypothetical protein BpHYR1_043906 [Brachionus plicatilis]